MPFLPKDLKGTSLQNYVRVCSDLLIETISSTLYWVPRCFVRIDVAHFIKICCKWTPLKTVSRGIREVVLRLVGILIKRQSLTEVRSLILSMFVVFTNETDGVNLNGQETACELHKRKLIEATSNGFVEFQQEFDNILALAESEDGARNLLEEMYDIQNEGLNSYENPFKSWADNIYDNSKSLVQEGSGTNPLFIPTLVPTLINIMKLLSLWSGVMVPIFGYGDNISSSTAIESSFIKLKVVTFKHIPLPTDIETFMTNHIKSLKGATLLRSARNENDSLSPLVETDQQVINANGHSPPIMHETQRAPSLNIIVNNIN